MPFLSNDVGQGIEFPLYARLIVLIHRIPCYVVPERLRGGGGCMLLVY